MPRRLGARPVLRRPGARGQRPRFPEPGAGGGAVRLLPRAARNTPPSRSCSGGRTCWWARCDPTSCSGPSRSRLDAPASCSRTGWSSGSSTTSEPNRARCRCSRPHCSRRGTAGTARPSRSRGTSRRVECTARSHTSPTTSTRDCRPRSRTSPRGIFLRLAEPGVGTDDVRRRAPLDELVVDDEHAAVLTDLVDHRLVVTNDATAEVAHEALLREWPRLRGWLEADREGRRVRRALANGAQEWAAGARDDDLLFRGSRLAAALDVAGAHPTEVNPLERDFLTASRAAAGVRAPFGAPDRDPLPASHGRARGAPRRRAWWRARCHSSSDRAPTTAQRAQRSKRWRPPQAPSRPKRAR